LGDKALRLFLEIIVVCLGCCVAGLAQATPNGISFFDAANIDSELLPLMDEFIELAQKAGIRLPFSNKISKITMVPHKEMLDSIRSRGDIMAVTIIEPEIREAHILLSENLKYSQELRVLLFHELLHAAGYGHRTTDCHWGQHGCGIMGRSTYPHVLLDRDRADRLIRASFRAPYLAKLPLLSSH